MQDKLYYKDGALYWDNNNQRVGCLNTEGYRVFGYDGVQYKEHRVIFEIINGYCPTIIDHINGIKDDNRPENLRGANPNQNQYNRTNIKGYRKSRNKYYSRISFEGKRIELGAFDNEQDAHSAYLKARELLYGEWHRTRFNELKKEISHALFVSN